MRIRCGPWAILFLGIFCGGTPGPNFAQRPEPPVAEISEPSPKIVARLGSAGFDLVEPVSTVAWSRDGRFLASATESRTPPSNVHIDLWNAATGERIWRMESQVQKAGALEFSSDGRTLVETGSETASAMDVATGKRIPLPMSTEPAVSAKLSRNRQGILLTYAVERKQDLTIACPREKDKFLSFRFSPDRRFLATGTQSGDLALWDVENGRRIHNFDVRISQISCLEFTPDGKLLIAAGSGRSLYVFHTETGRQRFRWDDAWRHVVLAVHPRGKLLVTAEELGGTVTIRNLENGRREPVIKRAPASVKAAAFSPDGTQIAMAGRAGVRSASLGIWDAASGKEMIPITGHARPATRLAFSSDGRFVATAALDGSVCLWTTQTGKLVSQLEGDASNDLCFSPDGWLLGAAGVRGSYRIWEVSSGDLLFKGDDTPNVGASPPGRFSPELDFLALALPQGKVQLIKTSTGETLPALTVFDKHEVGTLAFSSDGRHLAVGSGRPRLPNAPRGMVAILDVAKRERLRELQSPVDVHSHDLRFDDLTFSPDGGTLAATHSRLRIEFWQPTLGIRINEVSIPRQKPMAFSPIGQVLIVVGDSVDGRSKTGGSRIELMEVATGGVFQSWDIPHQVSAFALSPDGRRLALGLKDSRQVLLSAIEARSADEATRDPALEETVKNLTMEERKNFLNFIEQHHLTRAVEDLSMEDAKTGRRAMAVLLAGRQKSVRLLASHLETDGKPEGFDQRVERLIGELDDDDFFVREKATSELVALGPDAVPAMNAALEAKPPLEVKYRIRMVLKSANSSARKLRGQSLKRIRAIEILERIGTAEAEALLTSLAKTTQSAREAGTIRLALERMQQSSADR